MKVGIFKGKHNIQVEEVAEPKILKPTDAIMRITYSCICGSDLWYYRDLSEKEKNSRIGHELLGVVEEVGRDVTHIKKGDTVVAPFFWCDGTCPECKAGISSACRNGGIWGTQQTDGGQGQMTRVAFADASLFVIPKGTSEKLMPALLTLSDVMCTGHHAAVSAGVSKGKIVAVIGDGAVGLCAVLASKRLGAKKIILLSRHETRTKVGRKFGATDIVPQRGDEAVKAVKKLTDDLGVDCVLECVGTTGSWETAFEIVRAGGKIGYVGVPHDVVFDVSQMFSRNIGVIGGIAPAATYIPELLPDVLAGKIDPSPVFDMTIPLDELAKGYAAMDERKAIKVLVRP